MGNGREAIGIFMGRYSDDAEIKFTCRVCDTIGHFKWCEIGGITALVPCKSCGVVYTAEVLTRAWGRGRLKELMKE